MTCGPSGTYMGPNAPVGDPPEFFVDAGGFGVGFICSFYPKPGHGTFPTCIEKAIRSEQKLPEPNDQEAVTAEHVGGVTMLS